MGDRKSKIIQPPPKKKVLIGQGEGAAGALLGTGPPREGLCAPAPGHGGQGLRALGRTGAHRGALGPGPRGKPGPIPGKSGPIAAQPHRGRLREGAPPAIGGGCAVLGRQWRRG